MTMISEDFPASGNFEDPSFELLEYSPNLRPNLREKSSGRRVTHARCHGVSRYIWKSGTPVLPTKESPSNLRGL
eukprot:1331791-Amorphochlora_amoeboformis.AAC.1